MAQASQDAPQDVAVGTEAQPSFLSKHWQKMVAGGFWLVLIGGYATYIISNGLTFQEALQQPIDFMRGNPFAPLIFIGLYTLRPVVLFSAVLLSLAGGALFGAFWGIVYTIIGANLGATLAYFIGYFFGQDALEAEEGDAGRLQRWVGKMRENAFETVLTMRFIFLPYDLVNYLAGFLRINYVAFILATILGSLPGTLSFVLLGASTGLNAEGEGFNPWVLVASVAIFVASLGLSRLLKHRRGVEDIGD